MKATENMAESQTIKKGPEFNNYLINDLGRRYQLMTEIPKEELEQPIFYASLREYVHTVQKAILGSVAFHAFDHREHDLFEEEVCQKVMNDPEIEEQFKRAKIASKIELYYAPSFDQLSEAVRQLEKHTTHGRMGLGEWSAHGLREFLRSVHPTIIGVLEEELASFPTPASAEVSWLPAVGYHPATGRGTVNGEAFRLGDGQPEFKLFARLYEQVGTPVLKAEVLEILGINPVSKTATHDLTNLIGKLRVKTGLNTDQIIQNKGNITLLARKVG